MNRFIKTPFCVLTSLLTLTGCTANAPENITENTAVTAETLTETSPTEITALTETAPLTEREHTETAAPETAETAETALQTENPPPLPSPEIRDPRTLEYINSLSALEEFSDSPADILIADLNNDGIPEITVQTATAVGISKVYSIKDGKAFYVPPAPGSYTPGYGEKSPDYSFDGGALECYKKDGKAVFLADMWMGGSAGGTAGIMSVGFDGEYILSEAVSEIYRTKSDDTYFWGGKEVTEKEYKQCLENYAETLSYTDSFTVYIPMAMHVGSPKSVLEFIADGLDGFYESLDCESLSSQLEFTVRMKPIFSSIGSGGAYEDFTALSYDGFGNITEINRSSSGITSYENVYGNTGRLCRVTENNHITSIKEYEIDPEDLYGFDGRGFFLFEDNTPSDSVIIERDGKGRTVKKSLIASEEYLSEGILSPTVYADESYDISSRIQWTKEYEYDSFDRIVREEYTACLQDESDKSIHWVKTYEYDNEGRLCRYESSSESGDYSYEISYSQKGIPEKVVFRDSYADSRQTLEINEHYRDIKGGVTCLRIKGDSPYISNMDGLIYFAPVRTAETKR